MCSNIFIFAILLSLLNKFPPALSMGLLLRDLKFATSPNITADSYDVSLTTESMSYENLTENMENDSLFWALPTTNNFTEGNSSINFPETNNNESDTETGDTMDTAPIYIKPLEFENDDQTNTESTNQNITSNVIDALDIKVDQKIELPRNNCNLEITVRENHDLKLEIKFGKLEQNSSGKCCLTLNGSENNIMGILISNIHLSREEVVKVITADFGMDFVLKKYYSWSKYQPLILTESQKAYIVLSYNATNTSTSGQNSRFNLEVFSFQKH